MQMPIKKKCKKLLKIDQQIVCQAEVKTKDGIKELSRKVNFAISETEFKFKHNNHNVI